MIFIYDIKGFVETEKAVRKSSDLDILRKLLNSAHDHSDSGMPHGNLPWYGVAPEAHVLAYKQGFRDGLGAARDLASVIDYELHGDGPVEPK